MRTVDFLRRAQAFCSTVKLTYEFSECAGVKRFIMRVDFTLPANENRGEITREVNEAQEDFLADYLDQMFDVLRKAARINHLDQHSWPNKVALFSYLAAKRQNLLIEIADMPFDRARVVLNRESGLNVQSTALFEEGCAQFLAAFKAQDGAQ